ncbi:DUF4303 domain-containing protein [Leifsonia xyli]|uniref:DUF4303 domain-containing protein n=1 Tax=Leifsonia xyli TaxID=1575 RepID=UPI0002E1AE8C|nr:DUF4303 domain-containing protein [Leifsonia xyli]
MAALFEEFGSPFDRPPATGEALLGCLRGALSDLDAEGCFGSGKQRNAVVVNLSFPGADTPGELIAQARSLNPASALARYEHDLGGR